MARIKPDAAYPESGLVLRRTPGNPKSWDVGDGKFVGEGKEKHLDLESFQLIKTGIEKGNVARALCKTIAARRAAKAVAA